MSFYTTMTLNLKGTTSEINAINAIIADTTHNEAVMNNQQIEIYECPICPHIENVESLFLLIAKSVPNASFTCEGSIENYGAVDFCVVYHDHKLTIQATDSYTEFYADDYEDYDDFAESNDAGNRYTEEDFDTFMSGTWYQLECGEIVEEIVKHVFCETMID